MTPTQKLIEAAEAALEWIKAEDMARNAWDDCGCGHPEFEHWMKAIERRSEAAATLREAVRGLREAQAANIGPDWRPCVKLPITVHVREQRPGERYVSTREGITPLKADDLIMRGVAGEEYPIGRELFARTYRMGDATPTTTDAPAQAASGGEVVAFDDCRISLVTALHMLASDFENALYKFDGDDEARRAANGSIAHARKVAARWNWNGATPASAPPAGDPPAPAAAREVVEALRGLLACHTERAGFTMSMAASKEDFAAFMERQQARVDAAVAQARAALAAADAQRAQEGGE